MTRQHVIEAFCILSNEVRVLLTKRDSRSYAADCFCTKDHTPEMYNFEQEVMEFIEEAVDEKIKDQVYKMFNDGISSHTP